jgi:hypothetical protein
MEERDKWRSAAAIYKQQADYYGKDHIGYQQNQMYLFSETK